jgi:hypothetical protein|tara:strand:- start:73434 stop:73565 length:132 start_codon:yes stop_codon:yes gene_type:complete
MRRMTFYGATAGNDAHQGTRWHGISFEANKQALDDWYVLINID